jgi:GT2 family glycosyltransferase
MSFSLVTVVYNNESDAFNAEDVCNRISTVHASGIASGLSFDLIIIDNSPRSIDSIKNLACKLNAIYRWNDGYNVFHSGGMNIAAKMSDKDHIVYFCSSHGRVIDHSWITDLLAPLSNPLCGMSGCTGPCLFDRISPDPADHKRRQWHVQGAIMAMRRDLLLEVPYGNRFPHNYSDVSMSLELLKRGYHFINVPSVRSVGIGRVADTTGVKIIHDYS